MDLLKFDKRILDRNVKKGILTVEERDNHLKSLPDLEGEYEVISIPLYDHDEQPEEQEQHLPETPTGASSGWAKPDPSSPPPAISSFASPNIPMQPPEPALQTLPTGPSTDATEDDAPVFPMPAAPEPEVAMVHETEQNQHEPQAEVADDPDKAPSTPSFRPVGDFDDEGNPEGV